jgi:tetratricopeptide (TPR) repeat protein
MTMIAEHYNNKGDSTQAFIEIEKWREDYPEWQQNRVAMKMYNEGHINEAINIYRDIIRNNPAYGAAYSNLALAYMKIKNLDSANVYLEIAEGMNSYNHRVLANRGMYLVYKGNYNKAEEYFERALKRDSLISTAIVGLLYVYKARNDMDNYFDYLSRVVWYNETPVEYSRELGEYYLNLGNYKDAALVFKDAIKNKGLDSLYVDNLKGKYPQLKIE